MDFKLQLGDIAFERHELPESLTLGGEQVLAVRRFPGGNKSIQALGAFDVPVEWPGEFLYEGAIDRAVALDEMRQTGEEIQLTWGQFTKKVVISDFTFQPRNQYHIPYTIKLEVVQDPVTASIASKADTLAKVGAQVAVAAGAKPDGKTYTVQPGDTLTKIAAVQLKDPSKWQAIYQANTGIIKNPNLIYPGQKLVIPYA